MTQTLSEKEMIDAILKMCLLCIGPEDKLEVSLKSYTFNDNLKMSSRYFSMVGMFKGFAETYLKNNQRSINYSTAYNVGNNIIHMISDRIVQRNNIIQQTLNKYLDKEDIEFAVEKTKELFDKAKGNFSVILLTNLIDLTEISSVKIGKVNINKFDSQYLPRFPEQVPIKPITLLSLNDSISKEKFLENNKNNVAMEIITKGYHFNDEDSAVIDYSIEEFKQALAYLYMCEYYLKRVKGEQFKIKTKELQAQNLYFVGPVQTFKLFVSRINQSDHFIEVNSDINLPMKQFVIDNSTFEQIKNKCCLEQFNKLTNEIGGKITNRIRTSFAWFLKGMQEADMTDRAISFFISLESLLSFTSSNARDILAEHVALLSGGDAEYKYEIKKKFKKTYGLRNKIMHGGQILSEEDYQHINDLIGYVVWSLRNVLFNIEKISSCSNSEDDPIKVYFEKLKLGKIWLI